MNSNNDTLTLFLATSILAIGGVGLYMFNSTKDNKKKNKTDHNASKLEDFSDSEDDSSFEDDILEDESYDNIDNYEIALEVCAQLSGGESSSTSLAGADTRLIHRRVIEADNSCLFNAFAFKNALQHYHQWNCAFKRTKKRDINSTQSPGLHRTNHFVFLTIKKSCAQALGI